MQNRTKLCKTCVVASLAAGIIVLTGCRATMPKWNLFGSARAPSAEMLAGDGPTTTYPAPPGESATPMAIASTAGGTAGALNNPGPATGNEAFAAIAKANGLGGATNPAAARANGFGVPAGVNLASNRSSAGGSTPTYAASAKTSPSSQPSGNGFDLPGKNSSVPAIPPGYQFGTRETPPSSVAGTQGMGATSPSSVPAGVSPTSPYKIPSSYPAPGSTPGFAMPDSNVVKSATKAPSTGFTMPGASPTPSPTQSAPFEPKSTATSSIGMSLPTAGAASISPVGNETPARTASTSSEPAFSTASAELTPRSTLSSPPKFSNEGYAPGSTGSSAGYPTTSGFPATGTDNSFYR